MNCRLLVCLPVGLFVLSLSLYAQDWPGWRGPTHNGIADASHVLPASFETPRWRSAVPGRGHGSAIVFGERVYLQAADETAKEQLLMCFDRASGAEVWRRVVHSGGFTQKLNTKSSWANSSPATDGDRVYANFQNGDAVYTSAIDLQGNLVWQVKASRYKIHQGYGSCPLLYKDLLIVSADNKLGGAVMALRPESGEEVWRVERREQPNYPSPVVLNAAGKDQLFLTGTEKVTSLNPLTGALNWEIDGATTECVTTTVTDGKHIYSTGGYPKNHVAAIAADGSGRIVWENKKRVYVPSMICSDGFLYAVMDIGVAMCWDAATGEEQWKGRLGGTFSGSPVLVGDTLVVANEDGVLYVYRASPDAFELISKTKVADQVFSSPVICGGALFLRVANYENDTRQESLICFGQ